MDLPRLQSICDYYHLFFKALNWYNQILEQLSFKDAFWEVIPMQEGGTRTMAYTSLLWRRQCCLLISQMPPQKPGEWTELVKLSYLFTDHQKTQGIQLATRCLHLWNIITNDSRQVRISDMQKVISWQENLSTFSITSTRAKSLLERYSPAHEELEMMKNTHSLGSHYIDTRDRCPLSRQRIIKQNHCKCFPYGKLVLEEQISGSDLNSKIATFPRHNQLNAWLSLPLTNSSKSNRNVIMCQSEACTARGNNPGCKTSYLVDDALLCSKSMDHLCCQTPMDTKLTHHKCGVQTDAASINDPKLCFTQKHLEKDLLFCSRDNQQLQCDPSEGITSSMRQLTISKSLEDQLHDWDVKEEAKLCLIEKLLGNTEVILSATEQELELKQKQDLELMLSQAGVCRASCEAGDAWEEKTTTCEDTANVLSESTSESEQDMNKLCSSPTSINNDMNLSDCVIKSQSWSGGVLRELREVYAIEQQIYEETRKIQKFRDLEHAQAVEAQDTAFKKYKEKLLFLIAQQRERSQVEEMEQSLAKEVAKQQSNKMKKLEMLRIKKYCQEFVKEYLKSMAPIQTQPLS